MKKLLLAAVLFSGMAFGQTFSDLKKYGEYYGKSIAQFENNTKLKPINKEEKFGQALAIYKLPAFMISVEYDVDNSIINKIELFQFNIDAKKVSQLWYNATSAIKSDSSYINTSTSFLDEEKNFKTKELKYNELLTLLRSLDYPEKINYISNYEDKNIQLLIAGIKTNFIISIKGKVNDDDQ